jgi:hypothetical protein
MTLKSYKHASIKPWLMRKQNEQFCVGPSLRLGQVVGFPIIFRPKTYFQSGQEVV